MFPPEAEGESARIDREWEAERERYLVASRYGRRRYAPSAAAAVMMALCVAVVGGACVALALAGGAQGGGLMLLAGGVIVVAGLAISLRQYIRARRYGAAYRAYRRRRASVKERLKVVE